MKPTIEQKEKEYNKKIQNTQEELRTYKQWFNKNKNITKANDQRFEFELAKIGAEYKIKLLENKIKSYRLSLKSFKDNFPYPDMKE